MNLNKIKTNFQNWRLFWEVNTILRADGYYDSWHNTITDRNELVYLGDKFAALSSRTYSWCVVKSRLKE